MDPGRRAQDDGLPGGGFHRWAGSAHVPVSGRRVGGDGGSGADQANRRSQAGRLVGSEARMGDLRPRIPLPVTDVRLEPWRHAARHLQGRHPQHHGAGDCRRCIRVGPCVEPHGPAGDVRGARAGVHLRDAPGPDADVARRGHVRLVHQARSEDERLHVLSVGGVCVCRGHVRRDSQRRQHRCRGVADESLVLRRRPRLYRCRLRGVVSAIALSAWSVCLLDHFADVLLHQDWDHARPDERHLSLRPAPAVG